MIVLILSFKDDNFMIVINRALNIVFLCCLSLPLFSQSRYWIKGDSDDFPSSFDLEPVVCSEWLDQCSYTLPDSSYVQLKSLGYDITPVTQFVTKNNVVKKRRLGYALEQIEAIEFINAGLNGKGVKIGVIDGGFLKANTTPSLSHLFEKGRVKFYKDYITPTMEPYKGSAPLDDVHGTEVMVNIGGINNKKNVQFGIATESEYYLARTDHGAYEKRLEEDLLILAMEEMHKMGIRLINISLGYAAGYVLRNENYKPADMDGKTSAVARAVDTAFYKKNMLIVVAAGNEGIDPKWKVLSTPGDARGALTVGATKLDVWDKMDYSSIGTPSLDYMKPEISCFATEGTSFSTPIITGIAAGIMQYDSTLTAREIKEIINQSGNYYPFGNNYLGYGIPRCSAILQILKNEEVTAISPKKVTCPKNKYVIKGKFNRKYIVAFHKKAEFKVVEREIYRPEKSKVKIVKHPEATRTSVLIDNQVIEIFWE